MTFELAACILFALVALPVSKSIMLHYLIFAGLNFLFLGYEFSDSSLLAIAFGFAAVGDLVLFILGGRMALLFSAVTMLALSFESIGNGDWLLNHSIYISVATNAVILGTLIREYMAWMRGRSEPY